MGTWIKSLHREPVQALSFLRLEVVRLRPRRAIALSTDEIVSEIAWRTLGPRSSPPPGATPLGAWVGGILNNLRHEAQRGGPKARSINFDSVMDMGGDVRSVDEIAERAASDLPDPYRVICRSVFLRPERTSIVQAAIMQAGRVGRAEAQRLMREAKDMLKAVLTGADAKTQWPRRYRACYQDRWARLEIEIRGLDR